VVAAAAGMALAAGRLAASASAASGGEVRCSESGHDALFPTWPAVRALGTLVPDRPGRGGESARQRPATYSSGTGTDRTSIRFTTRADRPARRGTYGIPHAGSSRSSSQAVSSAWWLISTVPAARVSSRSAA